jgi:predicted nucleic acid-binding protein
VKRLIDTNVLVYLHDPRFPAKQGVAAQVLEEGLESESIVVPHQAILEFVAAVSRPRPELAGLPLLALADALREAEDFMAQFPVLYPDSAVVRTALRGTLTYQLPWFDAHLWAYAEVHGAGEILSEDFEHGRLYGSVRARDPFLEASGEVRELPALYEAR